MKKAIMGFIVTTLATISLSSFAAETTCHVQNQKGQNFKGNFSYIVSGEFSSPLGSGKMTEVGVFTSDGRGNVRADATANIVSSDLSIALPSGQASYNCTYTDALCASTVVLHCVRHQPNFIPQDQSLDLVLAMVKGSPIVKIEALSGGTFGNVQVSGEASRSIS